MNLNLNYYKRDIIFPKLEILKNIKDYEKDKSLSYEKLYYSKKLKNNVIDWYPFKKGSNILEINSGMENFTETLCGIAKKVTKIEFSKADAEYLSKKYEEIENLEIIVGDLTQINFENKFDYIILLGNLEYSKYIFETNEPEKDLILTLKKLLNKERKNNNYNRQSIISSKNLY